MISKKDLKQQRLMQMLIDLQEMGDDLVSSIKSANYEEVKNWKMPTDHMKTSVEAWESFWKVAKP